MQLKIKSIQLRMSSNTAQNHSKHQTQISHAGFTLQASSAWDENDVGNCQWDFGQENDAPNAMTELWILVQRQ